MPAISEYHMHGALKHSRLDRAILVRYYAFLVISQLVIFALIGLGFHAVSQIVSELGKHQSLQTIIDSFDTLPAAINATYIDQSSYWLTFSPLAAASSLSSTWRRSSTSSGSHSRRASSVGRLATTASTRAYRTLSTQTHYANLMFIGTVGLGFAPLAPLVAVAAAIVFWMSS